MTRYFAQNTPRAGLEHMMMSVPGFQKRGGGMMILSRFCYKPEDVDCRYCLHYRRRSCQVRTCPYIAERLKSGAIEYLDLILEYFGHIPHAGLHKRIQAVEHWSGPDQAVLHTVSVHLRSRFADRVWDDAPPGYLAALYLLASKERLWQPALPALSHDSIDFSRIVSKPHGFAIQDYPIFYSARRLYDLKSPMEAEDLAHPKLVSDLDFHNIIYATMIARYGKAVMDASMNPFGGYWIAFPSVPRLPGWSSRRTSIAPITGVPISLLSGTRMAPIQSTPGSLTAGPRQGCSRSTSPIH